MKVSPFQESKEISRFIRENVVEIGVAPEAVAGFAQRSEAGWSFVGGESSLGGLPRPFDLASVSKSLFVVALSQLVKRGDLGWSDLLHDLLPELRGTWAGSQSIEAHLSHRAGMVPHLELFLESRGGAPVAPKRLLLTAARAKRQNWNGDALYSDLGYLLVGSGIERRFHTALDVLLAEELFIPWGLRVGSARAFRASDAQYVHQFVPTEIQPPRGGSLQGQVHDDNAWALSGSGCSGHAGLFGTLESILRFGSLLLDAVEDPVLEPLLRVRPGGTLRMGFDGIKGPDSMAGRLADPHTFGHLGFTGTSFWCDPVKKRVTALLSNRVYPTRDNPKIRLARPKMHDFLWMC